jgi:hypothetical protein
METINRYDTVVRAMFSLDHKAIGIYIISEDRKAVATSITMVRRAEGEHMTPVLWLTEESHSGQQLMDDLWSAGLRPTEGAGSAGQLTSVQGPLS